MKNQFDHLRRCKFFLVVTKVGSYQFWEYSEQNKACLAYTNQSAQISPGRHCLWPKKEKKRNVHEMQVSKTSIAWISELRQPILDPSTAKWPRCWALWEGFEEKTKFWIFRNVFPGFPFFRVPDQQTKYKESDFSWKIYPGYGNIRDTTFGKTFIYY